MANVIGLHDQEGGVLGKGEPVAPDLEMSEYLSSNRDFEPPLPYGQS